MSNHYDYRYTDRSDAAGGATPSWVLGMIAGAAVGGGLALLFAPRQGTDMRHELAARGQAAGRQIKQAYESATGTARRSAQRLTEQARTWRDEHSMTSGESSAPLVGATPQSIRTASDYRTDVPPVFRDPIGNAAP